jgi:hypothetical protein
MKKIKPSTLLLIVSLFASSIIIFILLQDYFVDSKSLDWFDGFVLIIAIVSIPYDVSKLNNILKLERQTDFN